MTGTVTAFTIPPEVKTITVRCRVAVFEQRFKADADKAEPSEGDFE